MSSDQNKTPTPERCWVYQSSGATVMIGGRAIPNSVWIELTPVPLVIEFPQVGVSGIRFVHPLAG